jgi:hypothetical protein
MAKLWRKSDSSTSAAPVATEVDLPALKIDKPSVIFLNGFFVMDKNKAWASASLKTMEDMMAMRAKPAPDVDVFSYTHTNLKDIFNVMAYWAQPQKRFSPIAQNLAAGALMPLVAKDFKLDEKGNSVGVPLPLEDAKKNLRNVTFFCYSAGGVIAQECYNASLSMMKEIGFSDKDAKEALHEVVSIGVGTPSRPQQEKDRFTTLYLEATNDKIVQVKNRLWEPLKNIFSRFAQPLKIKPLGEHAAMITASVPKRSHHNKKLLNGKTVKEKVRNLLPSFLAIVKTYHELPRYVTEDENFSPFAKMVQYGLTNAVARSKTLKPLDLLDAPAGIDQATAAAYLAKISAAKNAPQS